MGTDRQVREFLYVDVDRTRSLLAQMQNGIVEAVRSQRGHTTEAGASARILGFGGEGGYAFETRAEESRSLQDLTFAVFEDVAEENGFIFDLGKDFAVPDNWARGRVHDRLIPGQVVRLSADLQILDGGLFRDRMKRFDTMAAAVLKISPQPNVPGNAGKKQRDAIQRKAREALMGGITTEQIDGIAEFVEAFLGDSIALRVLPCGPEHLEYGFAGALLGREEYLQEEREHLFSRYGNQPSGWTAVLQVAAIPDPSSTGESTIEEIAPIGQSTSLSRPSMERMATSMLGYMEQLGLMEGPRWPSVSVTPLGIYRRTPTSE